MNVYLKYVTQTQGPRYNLLFEGAMGMGKPGDEQSSQNLETGSGGTPQENLRPRSSDCLKVTLIFAP